LFSHSADAAFVLVVQIRFRIAKGDSE